MADFLPSFGAVANRCPETNATEEIPEWSRFLEERFAAGSQDLYAQATTLMEKHLIAFVLRKTGGNQSRAAAALGISRTSLRGKIHSLGIRMERTIWPESDQSEK